MRTTTSEAMTKSFGIVVVACLAVCASDATAGLRLHSARRLSTQFPPTFVGPGVTLTIHEVNEEVAEHEASVLAVSVTLANVGGVPLNARHRDFALTRQASLAESRSS